MLEVITRQKALEMILAHAESGRNFRLLKMPEMIASQDLISPEDLPDHSRSTVDGFAVYASDTYGCSDSIPAMLEYDGAISMGMLPDAPLEPGHCMAIPTGGYLPEGADAVSMIEYTDDIGDEFRYILKPVAVSENVNRQGDDCRKGDTVVCKGETVMAKNIAIMAALGMKETGPWLNRLLCDTMSTEAKERPFRLAVLSTGDELLEYDAPLSPGMIRNINSCMLAAAARELGILPVLYPIVKDEKPLLEEAVERALSECDALCISGGTSVGERDNVYKVLSEKGSVEFHGLSIKPGKPTMFAMIEEKPVFGLPGHPAAAFFIFRLLVRPYLMKITHQSDEKPKEVFLPLSRKLSSNNGREEIVPVKMEAGKAVPIRASSGVVSVLSKASGYIIIDRNTEGILEGTPVRVILF